MKVPKIYIILLCAAAPIWIVNFLSADTVQKISLIVFLILLFILCYTTLRSSNRPLRMFTGGALISQGIIPLFVSYLLWRDLPPVVYESLSLGRITTILTTPGYDFFLQLENFFSLNAVTYQTWYEVLRTFMIHAISCIFYGLLAVLFYYLIKKISHARTTLRHTKNDSRFVEKV